MSQISFAHRLTLNNKVIRNDHIKKLQITEKVNEISVKYFNLHTYEPYGSHLFYFCFYF